MEVSIDRVKKRIKSTVATKRHLMYDSHLYWSQKPYNICDILIEELSEMNDTIYDPFLGSGVTMLEALRNNYRRKAIGCEINEAPIMIVNTLMKKRNLLRYKKDADSLIKRVQELKYFYTTKCIDCDNEGMISTVEFDMVTRVSRPNIKSIKYYCPKCKRKSKHPDENDVKKMTDLHDIKNISNDVLHENTKIAAYRDETINQIFTPRNFKVVDMIIGMIKEYPNNEDAFRYVLMSILHLCKITDSHSNSQWPLWIPKVKCIEKNVVELFCRKIKKFEDVIAYLNNSYDYEKNYKLINKGSQFVSNDDIEDNSVDLIITDPPYLGQVAYSEYMQLYKPFLGLAFNLEDEIIVTSSPERRKSEIDYFNDLNKVFAICRKKLKLGGYFCMYFHDSNLTVWNRLIKCMEKNHFRYISQEHVNKSNTLKNIISPKKSLNGDAILFFIKEECKYESHEPLEDIEEIEINIVKHIRDTVKVYGEKSTTELYDEGLIEYLIYNGWLSAISKKYKTLVDLFEKYLIWNEKSNKWSLAG